ncbi:hypothetical protein BGW38_002512, partial [Lunasporangiospora selenospora]
MASFKRSTKVGSTTPSASRRNSVHGAEAVTKLSCCSAIFMNEKSDHIQHIRDEMMTIMMNKGISVHPSHPFG